ncbi:MAG: NAD-dependent epimerase/dehydratase family protein [Anaerolineae bacterium]
MKVLIIGGSGLISTGITTQLLSRGDEVWWYNRGRSASTLADEVHLIQGDRTAASQFEAQVSEAGPWDCVIDMICYTPEEAASAVRALEGCTAHYVFCSTVDVYTKPSVRYPIVESCERAPRKSFPYAYHKAACERVLWDAYEAGRLPLTVIRPAHTYGEGGRVLHTFGFDTWILDRVRRGMPLVVHGDGRSLWSCCHRDDVATAFVSAAAQPGVAVGKAYHVTGEEWVTWDRYYETLAQALDVPCPPLVHVPSALLGQTLPEQALWCVENFSFNNIFDNSAVRRDLGFQYRITMLEGFRRMVYWLQANDQIQLAESAPYYDALIRAWECHADHLIAELAPFRDAGA